MDVGRTIVVIGLVVTAAGLLVWAWPGAFGRLGRLPGDLSFSAGGVRIFIPLTSLILVNLVLFVVSRLFRW